jgi:lactate oxidase
MYTHVSRRGVLQALGLGLAGLGTGGAHRAVRAQQTPGPSNASGGASQAGLTEKDLAIINTDLLEEQARALLPAGHHAYYARGFGDEWTLRENRRAFNDFPILPRRLTGTHATDLRTTLLGHALPFPMIVAPTGLHGLAHATAELGSATGTARAGTLYTASASSNKPLEEIARATAGPKWFQVYLNKDEGVSRSLLQRAKAAGYSAIVLTVDGLFGPGVSDEFLRLGAAFPPELTFGNYDPRYGGGGSIRNRKTNLGYDDIGFVRETAGLPVVVKGILRGEDARQSLRAGAAAVQVSNHGGRQQDGVPAAISVLRSVVDAVEGQTPVLFDSGIRRGVDVFRALALGATAVAIGRPVIYGLVVGGARGVSGVLDHLGAELRTAMLVAGVGRISDITRDHLLPGAGR